MTATFAIPAGRKSHHIDWKVYHSRPHEDEAACDMVLCREPNARILYPGIENAGIKIFDPKIYGVGTEEQWLAAGYLFVGVGGHRYDDHPHKQHPDDCAFTLVLKDLGLHDDPVWRRIGDRVFEADRQPMGVDFHIANLIKALNYHDGTPQEVFHIFSMLMYRGYIPMQRQFQKALGIIRGEGNVHKVRNERIGQDLTLYVVESDGTNFQLAKAARSEHGYQADVVVVINTLKNHVYVSLNHSMGLRDASILAAGLRQLEVLASVGVDEMDDWTEDGMGAGWFHQEEAGSVFKGSLTAVHEPGTKVHTTQITAAAMEFMKVCPVDQKRRVRNLARLKRVKDSRQDRGERRERQRQPEEQNRGNDDSNMEERMAKLAKLIG